MDPIDESFLTSCFPTASSFAITKAVSDFSNNIDGAIEYLLQVVESKEAPGENSSINFDDGISDDELVEALRRIHQYETDALLAQEMESQLQLQRSTSEHDERMSHLLNIFEAAHDDPKLLAFIDKTSRQSCSLDQCISTIFEHISKESRKSSKKKILLFNSSQKRPNYESPTLLSSSNSSNGFSKKAIESSLSYLPTQSTLRYNHFLTLAPSTTYLDLHHLTLSAALHVLSVHLPKWYNHEMDRNGGDKKRMEPCYIVTGIGKHTDGKPVLFKNIGRWLGGNGWRHVEGDGSYLVLGKKIK